MDAVSVFDQLRAYAATKGTQEKRQLADWLEHFADDLRRDAAEQDAESFREMLKYAGQTVKPSCWHWE